MIFSSDSKIRSYVFNSDGENFIDSNFLESLVSFQLASYEKFLYGSKKSEVYSKDDTSVDSGIMSVIRDVFPVIDRSNIFAVDIISYTIQLPLFSITECLSKDETYAIKMRIKVRIIVWDKSELNQDKQEIKNIKEQTVYFCDLPLMTGNAHFVINGSEYVAVSQIHRSPGLLFESVASSVSNNDQQVHLVRIIPYRGSWLEIEFDIKDIIYCRVDKKRKFHITTFLRFLKYDTYDILNVFYKSLCFHRCEDNWLCKVDLYELIGYKSMVKFFDKNGNVLFSEGQLITSEALISLQEKNLLDVEYIVDFPENVSFFCANDVIDDNGEIIYSVGEIITKKSIQILSDLDVKQFDLLLIDNYKSFPYIINTLLADKNDTYESALSAFYKIIRPGEVASVAVADFVLRVLFFNENKYDLSRVGRMKINEKLGFKDVNSRVLRVEDILEIIKALIDLRNGSRNVDDVDDLSNRRVRLVGELIEGQFRSGLLNLSRSIIDRLSSRVDVDTVMPFDIFNSKSINSALMEFFLSSQLSQFMDHVNPLSEITHKRRITALGPGGLTRERAGFEVRDVHGSHYGRICTAETPDNNAVGLVNNLALFSRIDKYGFIEVPYYKVVDGIVTKDVVFLSSFHEKGANLAQANVNVDPKGKIIDDLVYCRRDLSFVMVQATDVDYVDVASCQIVSITSSLIPFLENNDVSRALMGANMQRQAIPLQKSEAAWVGTGMESLVIRDAGAAIFSKIDGIVTFVDNSRIIIVSTEGDLQVDVNELQKYRKSNANTCIHFIPRVDKGQAVKRGQLLADGFASANGELALGRNLLTAIMVFEGLNFEDSVVISDKVAQMFASNHIEELECIACDTKLGPEEITRDIPHINVEDISNLDESGIIFRGTKVSVGDILVGKITPINEMSITPEEKLLRMVFGEKSIDVKDSSLYVPSGVHGTVIDVQVRFVKGLQKDSHLLLEEKSRIESLISNQKIKIKVLDEAIINRFREFIVNNEVIEGLSENYNKEGNLDFLHKLSVKSILKIKFSDDSLNKKIEALHEKYIYYINKFDSELKSKVSNMVAGDDLGSGVLKVVKVFIAMNHCLQPGDKISGRYGNKGVISKVIPACDMPHLDNGKPVDIIINPLGVPSRMNIGQIRENHMGWFCYKVTKKFTTLLENLSQAKKNSLSDTDIISKIRNCLKILYSNNNFINKLITLEDANTIDFVKRIVAEGFSVAIPVFKSPSVQEICDLAKKLDIDIEDRVYLFDPITGDKFHRRITVGFMYFNKLHHMAHFKMHARSIGPYSLVTQQPLGGRSHFGGQRLGEMEVWALEAYGAAYNVLEMLTVKSDDVIGRLNMYESIIKGDNTLKTFIPEALKVFKSEIASLVLDLSFHNYDDEDFAQYCNSLKDDDSTDNVNVRVDKIDSF